MLGGSIKKQKGIWWAVEVPAIGVFTQGRSRRDATWMLKDAVKAAVGQKGFTVTVKRQFVAPGVVHVVVACNRPVLLAELAAKYARAVEGSTPERARALKRALMTKEVSRRRRGPR